jgi:hypothetical protein
VIYLIFFNITGLGVETTSSGTSGGGGGGGNGLRNSREDVFSSTSKLEELVHMELQVLDLLTTFTEYTIEKAALIKK